MATAVLRTFLGNIARPIALHPRAPVLVVATPAGQLHELGAIIVAAASTSMGWRVVYAGACLPAEEIVSLAIHQGARAVGLSVVHPTDDPILPQELKLLRRLLPGATRILVGGGPAALTSPISMRSVPFEWEALKISGRSSISCEVKTPRAPLIVAEALLEQSDFAASEVRR